MITLKDYEYDKVSGQWRPGQYPGEKLEKWSLPEDISADYARLNSMIETKYTREYLKICAYYNKMFPSLRTSGYITSTYNTMPFTTMDQERADTGTGISSNYLKQIGDQLVSRLGTLTFEPALLADVPTLEYIIYKDEVERLLRKIVRDEKLTAMMTEVFHDAAIVGFSHVFIDPVNHVPVKANDYEVGIYESQFNSRDVKQMLYRNYAFPVTSLAPYLKDNDDETVKEVTESTAHRDWCDLKLFFDCPGKRVVVTIDGKTIKDVPYPFDSVQMVTFGWDVGFTRVTSTSLFDLLYPTQRELNKINAKVQQLVRMYKGAVPVFNNDVDLLMKQITNGSGEALYVDSSRPIDSLMTVLNPTPIDPQLSALKTEMKTEMYELAGIQQVSFDMENIRSAATLIAIDQTRDTVFQAQMAGIANFISQLFRAQVHYNAKVRDDENPAMRWSDVDKLINDASIELKPVIATNPLGNKAAAEAVEPDYEQMSVARALINMLRGEVTYDTLPFTINKGRMKIAAASLAVRMSALGVATPDELTQFLIAGFIDDMKLGLVAI